MTSQPGNGVPDPAQSSGHTHIIQNVPPGTVVRVGEPPGGRWFRMFHALMTSGAWARMSAAAKAVYPVVAERCDREWVAKVKLATLARLSGLSRSSVNRAAAELKDSGLMIVRTDGRGRGCGVYQLIPPLPRKGTTGDTLNVPRVRRKGATGDTLNVPPLAHSSNKERARGFTSLSRLQQQDVSAAAVRCALMEAGIGEPVLSELAGTALTAQTVRAVAAGLAGRGRGSGAIVNQLRIEAERATQRDLAAQRKRFIQRRRDAIGLLSDAEWSEALTRAWPNLIPNLRSQLQLAGASQRRSLMNEFDSGIAALWDALDPEQRERIEVAS